MSLTSLWAALSVHLVLISATASDPSNSTTSTQTHLIPWEWYVKPDIPNYVCPSVASTLGTFAVVNVLVSIFNLVFGHKKVINFLTCGFLGRPFSENHWWFMFLLPLGLNLGANALIAFLYLSTPGYEQGFSIGELTLFYTTRPRLGWLVLSLFMYLGDGDDSGPYEDSAKGAVFAEVFLLLVSTYYTGMTAHFATSRGYYITGRLEGPDAHDARIMYSGALMSLVLLLFAILYLVFLLLPRSVHERQLGTFIWGVMTTSWLASWLFWAGYVRLAGDL